MVSCTALVPGPATRSEAKWLHVAAALAFLCASVPNVQGLAQGIENEEAIDAIIGSDVKTTEAPVGAESGRVLSAVANAAESADEVHKAFNIAELDIVFVPDIAEKEPQIEQAIAENEEDIQSLQEAIEASALFYHALDSRSVAISDVIGMEFGEEVVTVFVSGSAPK